MAYPTVTYTFSNSTTADATQVNQNFTDLINGLSDGTKDLSISALTVAGTATLNGAVNLGNATSDDITITGYLASSFIPKTNQTYDIGTADLGLRALYLGVASAGALTAKVIASASIAADRIYTMPEAGADASFVMTDGTQTISGAKTFDTAGNAIKGIASGGTIASGYIGEVIAKNPGTGTNAGSTGVYSNVLGSGQYIALTAGRWSISASFVLFSETSTTIAAGNNQLLIISTNETNDNSGVDSNYGSDRDACETATTRTPGSGVAIASLKVNNLIVDISGTTNYYAKGIAQYGSTAPKWYGKLQAIRIG